MCEIGHGSNSEEWREGAGRDVGGCPSLLGVLEIHDYVRSGMVLATKTGQNEQVGIAGGVKDP